MITRELVGAANVPGGEALRLFRRGAEFVIMLGANELMNSRTSGSEEALATIVCDRLRARKAPRLLVGGYGMGFTLRAALGVLENDSSVTVAEIVPEILAWASGPMAELTGGCLEDPRVDLVAADVSVLIAQSQARWDAILLDVDNGPDGLTREGNDRLYSREGLKAARASLRPGGVLAVWSAAPDASFTRRLRDCGFAVEEVVVRARPGGKGQRHLIWLATKR